MASLDLTAALGLIVVSFCVATAALIAAIQFADRTQRPLNAKFDPHEAEPAVFLFDSELLVDATDRAQNMLRRSKDAQLPWQQLMDVLAPYFSDVESLLGKLPRGERLDLWSGEDFKSPLRLIGEWRNGMLRITVIETDESESLVAVDAQSLFAMEKDVSLLRAISENAPNLIWRSDRDGNITWANKAYLDLAKSVLAPGSTLGWPPPSIFDPVEIAQVEESQGLRISCRHHAKGALSWFEVYSAHVAAERLMFAMPADAAVSAQDSLRELIQTLARTFAHLPIGLAIFNQKRRLELFNPALTDLSALSVSFLSARPTLATFLDELRNQQIIPEPKDYRSWRQQITDLEAAAVKGTYAETWSLPNGQTFRVTGRPHPKGAIAFLFEDITSEVTLTRRFRTDMELGQAVIDSVSEALAVFSPAGVLTLSNAAYAELWGVDPNSTLGDVTIIDASKRWSELSRPTPVWGDVREFVGQTAERAAWTAEVDLVSGAALACRFVPLTGGGTLIGFAAPLKDEAVGLLMEVTGE